MKIGKLRFKFMLIKVTFQQQRAKSRKSKTLVKVGHKLTGIHGGKLAKLQKTLFSLLISNGQVIVKHQMNQGVGSYLPFKTMAIITKYLLIVEKLSSCVMKIAADIMWVKHEAQ